MNAKLLSLTLLAILTLSGIVAGWNITVDYTTPSSIVWNLSEKPGTITFVSYDGINITKYDPDAVELVQSDLSSNTYHSLKVIADGETAIKSQVTNESAADKVNTDIDTWFLVGAVLVLFFCGFAIHWFLFWIGSFVSLYGMATFILEHSPIQANIWNLQFLIYGALFVMGFVLWAFRKRKGFR